MRRFIEIGSDILGFKQHRLQKVVDNLGFEGTVIPSGRNQFSISVDDDNMLNVLTNNPSNELQISHKYPGGRGYDPVSIRVHIENNLSAHTISSKFNANDPTPELVNYIKDNYQDSGIRSYDYEVWKRKTE